MSKSQLTPAQQTILAHAIQNTGGKLDWFPDNIKGGARAKVLTGLQSRALITSDGTSWFVAAEGYDALGAPRPTSAAVTPPIKESARKAPRKGPQGQDSPPPRPSAREHSKQATVIKMLQRAKGATIQQLCEATGWQAHTVRGAIAGALKKKLGLNVVSEKTEGRERIYRIA